MKASIKEMYSLEIETSLQDYIPTEKDNFEIVIRLMIGTKNEDTAESFDITVCSAKRIMAINEFAIWGKSFLIVDSYDCDKITNVIKHRIESIVGKDWDDLAVKISRLADWEFEDYHVHK